MRDTSIASGEMRQDAAAGWIRQGGECAIQGAGLIFNHLVKYVTRPFQMQIKKSALFLKLKNETNGFPILMRGPRRSADQHLRRY